MILLESFGTRSDLRKKSSRLFSKKRHRDMCQKEFDLVKGRMKSRAVTTWNGGVKQKEKQAISMKRRCCGQVAKSVNLVDWTHNGPTPVLCCFI